MRKEKPLDKNEKCGRGDCDKKQYKLTKRYRPPFGVCKRHYYQYDYTDPFIEKIKKYGIIVVIAGIIIAALNYFK